MRGSFVAATFFFCVCVCCGTASHFCRRRKNKVVATKWTFATANLVLTAANVYFAATTILKLQLSNFVVAAANGG